MYKNFQISTFKLDAEQTKNVEPNSEKINEMIMYINDNEEKIKDIITENGSFYYPLDIVINFNNNDDNPEVILEESVDEETFIRYEAMKHNLSDTVYAKLVKEQISKPGSNTELKLLDEILGVNATKQYNNYIVFLDLE